MIKKDELKKLKNAEKIELVTLNRVKGFTFDMVETIVNRLIEAFNNNEEEEFTIKVNNFKMTVYADKLNYINLLDKFHAKIKVAAENKLYTDFKAYLNNTLIKTSDNYITDGSIMLKADYVGAIPEGEILGSANINIKQVITDDNFIKLDNYKKVSKNKKVVFYKDLTNFIAFNKFYFDLLPKKANLYLAENKNAKCKVLVAVMDNSIIGVLFPITVKDLTQFKKDFAVIPAEAENIKDDFIKIKELLTDWQEKTNDKKHYNPVTNKYYHGNNAAELDKAMLQNDYKCSLWLASGQAKKMNKQVKTGASGVLIKVYYEDESGRSFCKLEKIYNVAELEPIQKIENTEKYKNLIEKLRA